MNIHKSIIALALAFAAAATTTVAAAPKAASVQKAIGATPKARLMAKVRAPHIIPESGILDATDLLAIARLATKASTDEFSDDPTLKYIGREFVFTLWVGDLMTEYDKNTHTLTVATWGQQKGFELGHETTNTLYGGQNSYGAKASVLKKRGNFYYLENPRYSMFYGLGKTYSFVVNIDGVEARAISKALRLRITGTIKMASGVYAHKNSLISESATITEPTVDFSEDIFFKEYLIAANFTKAEWIDARTGAVIKTEDLGAK